MGFDGCYGWRLSRLLKRVNGAPNRVFKERGVGRGGRCADDVDDNWSMGSGEATRSGGVKGEGESAASLDARNRRL